MPWTDRQRRLLGVFGIELPADATAAEPAEALSGAANATTPSAPPPAASTRSTRPAAPRPAPPGTATELGSRPAGVERMEWDALRAAVQGCTACKLCRGRTQTVFGVGHERSHWMVVGEAPGEQEDLRGEPFVGKSGQLLDSMLRAIGVGRALHGAGEPVDPARQVYIANTVKCRPPGNRNPQPEELAQCEPFLVRQVELVRPRIILAMGRFAVQSLLRTDEPIGRLRGRVHRWRGVPLIVTYHPAYLLRSLDDKARAWDDLCLAWRTMRTLPPATDDAGAEATGLPSAP